MIKSYVRTGVKCPRRRHRCQRFIKGLTKEGVLEVAQTATKIEMMNEAQERKRREIWIGIVLITMTLCTVLVLNNWVGIIVVIICTVIVAVWQFCLKPLWDLWLSQHFKL